MKTTFIRRYLTNNVMALLGLALATAAQAQIYKSHTGTSLTSGSSWNGGSAPTSSGIAAWTNTSLGAGLTLSSSASWLGISVMNATANVGITGSGTLTLGSSGINMASSAVSFSTATPITLGASQTWSVNSGQTLTASGVIGGAYAITESGAGKLILSGLNTYTGGTAINGGILNVDAAETAGTKGPLGKSGTISFGGGTLQYTSADTADYSSRFSTVANQTYSVDTDGQSVTWATALTSSGGSLTLNDSLGTGTLTLSGANSYSGNTTNSAGTLKLGAANAIPYGSSAGNVVINPGSGATATLNLNGNNQGINGLSSGSSTGAAVIGQWPANEGSGTNIYNHSANTVNWNMALAPGGNPALWGYWQPGAYAFAQGDDNAETAETAASAWTSGANLILQASFNVCGNVNDAGQVFAGGAIFGGGYFTATGNSLGYNAYAFYALITTTTPSAPTISFNISGIGSWTANLPPSVCNPAVNGGWNTVEWVMNNNKTANTMTLQFYLNDAALGAPINITGGYMQDFASISGYQGTRFYIGAAAWESYLAFQGSISNVSFTAIPQSAVVDGASGTPALTIGNNDASSTFSGVIQNSGGSLALTKTGSGTLSLSGFNTYSGGTSINGGVLNVNGLEMAGAGGPLGQSGAISFGGGTLQYSSTDTADYSSRFSTAASQAYNVDTAGQSVTWGAALTSSGGSLTITNSAGNGTLTLNNANTYTGATAVNAGTLLVNSPGSLAAGSTVTVATSATLGGTGTINGPTTVQSGGTLLPGSAPSIGTLTFGSSLTLLGTNIMEINKTASTADEIVMSGGTVTLGGNLTVANLAGILAAGDTFDLISGGTIAGGFSSVTLPSTSAQYVTGLWPVNEGSGATLYNHSTNNSLWSMTIQGNTALWGYWQPGAYAFAQGNNNAETAETAASAWASGNNLTLQADFNVCGNVNDSGQVFVGGGIFGGGYFTSGGNAQGYNTYAFYAVINTANPAAPDVEFDVAGLGSWSTALPTSVCNPAVNGGWNTAEWVIINNKTANSMTLQFRLNGAALGAPINITTGYMQDFAGISGYQGTKFYIGEAADAGYYAFRGSIRNVSLTASPPSSLATGLAWNTAQLASGGNGTISVVCDGTLAANAGTNQTLCDGGSAPIGGNPTASGGSGSGYTYSWSPTTGLNNATVANPTASPTATTTYTVTVTDALGCTQESAVTITVNPAPTASTGGNQSICAGSSTAGLGGSVGGGATGGTWSSSGTGSFLPNPTTLNATYNPSGFDNTAGAVLLTLTSTGQLAPCGPATAQVLVTINPAATASAGGSQTICAGSSTSPLGGSVGGGATGGIWSSSGTGTFLPNATNLNATYNPSGADNTAGTVLLTLTSTGQLAPCGPATAQVPVTINPAATVSAGGSQTICAGSSTSPLGGSVGGGATGGIWSSSGTGTFLPSTTTLNAMYNPSGADNTAGTVLLTLTSTGQLVPCGAATAQVAVTINALPAITNQPTNLTVCASSPAIFSVGASGGGLTYQWQVSSDGGVTFTNTSDFDTNASYTNLAATLDESSNQYQVIVSGACSPAATSAPPAVLTVSVPATASAGGTQVLCAGSSTSPLGGSVGGGASGGTWSSSGTGIFLPDANTLNATYNPSGSDIVAGTVLLTLTSTGQLAPCGAATAQVAVTINALPAITNQPTNLTVCASSPAIFSVGASGGGLTYQWQVSSDGGVTFTNTSDFDTNASYTNLAATLDESSNQYQVIVSGACSPAVTSAPPAVLTVNVPATASAGGGQVLCAGSSTSPLGGSVGGGASGGTWSSSGTGAFLPDTNTLNATYNPSGADILAGTVLLTLTSTGQPAACGAATAQLLVTFNPTPTAAAGSNQTICGCISVEIGGSPTAGGGTGPFSYNWTPPGGLDDATAANPTATVTSTTTYTVTVTDANGCTASNTVVLTIVPQPLIESITTTSGTNETLVWSSLEGQTYRMQYKNDLNDASWTDLTPDVIAAGATATNTDCIGTAIQRFYRVIVVCP